MDEGLTTPEELRDAFMTRRNWIVIKFGPTSSFDGLSSEIRKFDNFRNEQSDHPLCGIHLESHDCSLQTLCGNPFIFFWSALSGLKNIKFLRFYFLGNLGDDSEMHMKPYFSVLHITSLIEASKKTLQVLRFNDVKLTGTPAFFDEFAEALEALPALRTLEISNAFDLIIRFPGGRLNTGENYPLDNIIRAVSEIPMLFNCDFALERGQGSLSTRLIDAGPIYSLICAPSIEFVDLGEFNVEDVEVKTIADALRSNIRLNSLDIRFSKSEPDDSIENLILLAESLQFNNHLGTLRLHFPSVSPDLNPLVLTLIDALSKNQETKLRNLAINSHQQYRSDVIDAFADMLKHHNYSLVDLGFGKTDEDDILDTQVAFFGERASEIESYLFLNEQGRKELMKRNHSRNVWVDALSKWTHDLHALYFYVRTNPWLCQSDATLGSATVTELKKRKRFEFDTAAQGKKAEQKMTPGLACLKIENQQLVTKYTYERRQTSQLQARIKQLEEDNLRLKAIVSHQTGQGEKDASPALAASTERRASLCFSKKVKG